MTSQLENPDDANSSIVCIDKTIPWGVYVPPYLPVIFKPNIHQPEHDGPDDSTQTASHQQHHWGYVSIVEAKGKAFPCAFSRPVGTVIEAVKCRERDLSQVITSSETEHEKSMENENTNVNVQTDEGKIDQEKANIDTETEKKFHQKITITETRLHPEEALFLHMRGQFRIVQQIDGKYDAENSEETNTMPMDTQDLFCKMLPECKIPLAAYLAYAHLRAQGYNLIRYSEHRIRLLCSLKKFDHQLKKRKTRLGKETAPSDVSSGGENVGIAKSVSNQKDSGRCNEETHATEDGPFGERNDTIQQKEDKAIEHQTTAENGDDSTSAHSTVQKAEFRQIMQKYSDDVATALPPCVLSLENWNREVRNSDDQSSKLELAYYAYNPNSRFRRSNPGLPDFGVAIMPYQSDGGRGPTFDTLASLVSLCECSGFQDTGPNNNDTDSERRIPLRVVTVADGGAVIAFGVTHGEVPDISRGVNNGGTSHE